LVLTFTFYLFPFAFFSMDFLTEIIAKKRLRLAQAKEMRGAEGLRAQALDVRRAAQPHAFHDALADGSRVNVIAEVKRASPSRGVIRAVVEPGRVARQYEAGGAAAISVLTEEDRFQGSLDDLRAVRAAVKVPVLRKDFIFDEFQLYEAAAAGADALLLIVAALTEETLARLRRITEDELQMDALVEAHTKAEAQRAIACGATLIGINNRDLHTFNVSLDVSVQLARAMTPGVCFISESGLRTGADLARLRALGYKGFLIGETLMRADEPDRSLRALIDEAEGK
jgi:indole-3-glycerol phosphate synthase